MLSSSWKWDLWSDHLCVNGVYAGLELGSNDGHIKRVASFLFHPIFPFAISVQQSFMQTTIVNFHFRRWECVCIPFLYVKSLQEKKKNTLQDIIMDLLDIVRSRMNILWALVWRGFFLPCLLAHQVTWNHSIQLMIERNISEHFILQDR